MLELRRTSQREYTEHLKMTIAGDPGAGKTKTASTAPSPLFASTDPRFMSIVDNALPFVSIQSTDDVFELRQMLNRPLEERTELLNGIEAKTLVFDVVNDLQRIMQRERLREQNHDVMEMEDWVWLGERLPIILDALVALPMNVIFLVHLQAKDIGDNGSGWFQPALSGQVSRHITQIVDVSGIIKATSNVGVHEHEEGAPPSKIKRSFITAPSDRYPYVKDHSGRLPHEFPINFKDDIPRIQELMYADRAALPQFDPIEIKLPNAEVKAPQRPKLNKAKDRPVSAEEAKKALKDNKGGVRKVVGPDGKMMLVNEPSEPAGKSEVTTSEATASPEAEQKPEAPAKATRRKAPAKKKTETEETPKVNSEPTAATEYSYDGITSHNEVPSGVTLSQEHNGDVGYYCELTGRELPRAAKAEMSKLKFKGHVIHPDLWKDPRVKDLQPLQ